MHTQKNKVILLLKIEEKFCYISTCHIEMFSGFILINMELHMFKNRHAKHALDFGNSICTFKITIIKSCYY
jgi:hypothetical protein